jgi:branched-chain amino acid transport system permease protein
MKLIDALRGRKDDAAQATTVTKEKHS